jgi:hypothetical protein
MTGVVREKPGTFGGRVMLQEEPIHSCDGAPKKSDPCLACSCDRQARRSALQHGGVPRTISLVTPATPESEARFQKYRESYQAAERAKYGLNHDA